MSKCLYLEEANYLYNTNIWVVGNASVNVKGRIAYLKDVFYKHMHV